MGELFQSRSNLEILYSKDNTSYEQQKGLKKDFPTILRCEKRAAAKRTHSQANEELAARILQSLYWRNTDVPQRRKNDG